MAILLIAEYDSQTLSDRTARVLSAASKIGADVDVLVAGNGAKAAADAAEKLAGVRKVLLAEAAELENRLAEPLTATIVSLAGGYHTIIAPATTSGTNVMRRVAALLDVMQLSEIIEVVTPDTFKHPIYPCSAIQTVQSTDAKRMITVHGFLPGRTRRRLCPYRDRLSRGQPPPVGLCREQAVGRRTSRAYLVENHHLGRRAVRSSEKFREVILPVTDKLGAADGASRTALDTATRPMTGRSADRKVVAPDLYIACGVSGAIQHLAGKKDAKVIVAFNRDGRRRSSRPPATSSSATSSSYSQNSKRRDLINDIR
ncbi:electron transfer flavoprotein subunit alpha/FixB family protein [Mesorhizobium sp.]|uniref:electron transfer flavoprotein subunit alpha/FixB family protein n=1 Tax=Mesorhizobium sp. TaxID=1871066 RepID=UPI0025800ED4|nr:electron transfer flavoprotein subunit alpha/FixB family protein [Mesorhizobium sp.]